MGNLGVVITTVKGKELYLPLLLQVLAATDKQSDIVVVDDGNKGSECPLPPVRCVSTSGDMTGYSSSVNIGVKALNGEQYVAVLHDDIRLPDDFSFDPLIERMEIDELIGAIVPMLVKPRHTIAESFATFIVARGNQLIKAAFNNWYPEYPPANEEQGVDVMKSPFVFFRRDAFDLVNGYDEVFNPYGFEDFDITLRLKDAGYNVLYMPSVMAIHLVAQTINGELGEDLGKPLQDHLEVFKQRWTDSPYIVWKEEDI